MIGIGNYVRDGGGRGLGAAAGEPTYTDAEYAAARKAGVEMRTPFVLKPAGACPAGWRQETVWLTRADGSRWEQTWCHPPEGGGGSAVGVVGLAAAGVVVVLVLLRPWRWFR